MSLQAKTHAKKIQDAAVKIKIETEIILENAKNLKKDEKFSENKESIEKELAAIEKRKKKVDNDIIAFIDSYENQDDKDTINRTKQIIEEINSLILQTDEILEKKHNATYVDDDESDNDDNGEVADIYEELDRIASDFKEKKRVLDEKIEKDTNKEVDDISEVEILKSMITEVEGEQNTISDEINKFNKEYDETLQSERNRIENVN